MPENFNTKLSQVPGFDVVNFASENIHPRNKLAILGLTFGTILAACGGAPSLPKANATPNATKEAQFIEHIITEKNTVDCTEIVPRSSVDSNNNINFDIGAFHSVGNGPSQRKISTGFEPSIKSNNPQAAFMQVERKICLDPLFGVTVAAGIANTELGGKKTGNYNSVFKGYLIDASKNPNAIASDAAKFMPFLNNPKVNPQEVINENKDYQKLADKIITFLKNFNFIGFRTYPSILNYSLANGDLIDAGVGLPQVILSSNGDIKSALIGELTNKNGPCTDLMKIGFNQEDQRFEEFANNCSVNTTVTTPSRKIFTTTSTTVPKNSTTTVPTITTSTTTTSTTTPTPTTIIPPYYPPPTPTTEIGPKQDPTPPVGSGTYVGPNNPSDSTPTTETTLAPSTTGTTVVANSSSSGTTVPPSGCGSNCP